MLITLNVKQPLCATCPGPYTTPASHCLGPSGPESLPYPQGALSISFFQALMETVVGIPLSLPHLRVCMKAHGARSAGFCSEPGSGRLWPCTSQTLTTQNLIIGVQPRNPQLGLAPAHVPDTTQKLPREGRRGS